MQMVLHTLCNQSFFTSQIEDSDILTKQTVLLEKNKNRVVVEYISIGYNNTFAPPSVASSHSEAALCNISYIQIKVP